MTICLGVLFLQLIQSGFVGMVVPRLSSIFYVRASHQPLTAAAEFSRGLQDLDVDFPWMFACV
jgi:hypothetical protein